MLCISSSALTKKGVSKFEPATWFSSWGCREDAAKFLAGFSKTPSKDKRRVYRFLCAKKVPVSLREQLLEALSASGVTRPVAS